MYKNYRREEIQKMVRRERKSKRKGIWKREMRGNQKYRREIRSVDQEQP